MARERPGRKTEIKSSVNNLENVDCVTGLWTKLKSKNNNTQRSNNDDDNISGDDIEVDKIIEVDNEEVSKDSTEAEPVHPAAALRPIPRPRINIAPPIPAPRRVRKRLTPKQASLGNSSPDMFLSTPVPLPPPMPPHPLTTPSVGNVETIRPRTLQHQRWKIWFNEKGLKSCLLYTSPSPRD